MQDKLFHTAPATVVKDDRGNVLVVGSRVTDTVELGVITMIEASDGYHVVNVLYEDGIIDSYSTHSVWGNDHLQICADIEAV